MAANLEDARAARAKAAQQWAQQNAEFRNGRPTPTRAETQLIAAGDLVMFKDPDGSRIDPSALDALDDNDPPPVPAEIPAISGDVQVGSTLNASPGLVRPKRIFQWLRDEKPIPDATGLRYKLSDADLGAAISFRATRAHEVATSRQVGPIRRPDSWPPSAADAAD